MFTLLVACGPRDARYNPSHFVASKPEAPPDVTLPRGAKPGTNLYGMTIGNPADAGTCCAASAHLDLPIRKRKDDSVFVVSVYTPKGPQHLRIAFADGAARESAALGSGFGVQRFRVPADLAARGGVTQVRISASSAPYILLAAYFEPARGAQGRRI